ncbi:beta-ketoacyl-ACP synthase 3 [Micromonospora sp. CPCC 206061]|uniref:beta-ketoacyl-ACP synthase 3 n=1 Tax=Micromonospora sp. CPCC 206061 TaxID=3122410 RepID=UPI002FF1B426
MTSRGSRILGVGAYRPRRVVGNDEIAARIGVTAEWIERRSGIHSRRYAGPDETLTAMSLEAAGKALAAAGVSAGDVGCVIAATTTHLTQMPALATEVAHQLGVEPAGALDISAACAGFCYGLALASDLVRAGSAEYVLLLGAERVTDILDHGDPATAFLFADGAGAVVVGPSDTPRIGPVVWGSDGSRRTAVGMTGYWTRDLRDPATPWPVLGMSGWRVFRWATGQLGEVARTAVERAGLRIDQLGAFVPHQANELITDAIAAKLALPPEVAVARDIRYSGNTSAASIPLAIDALMESGEVAHGASALLIGFGSGLVYAAQVAHLP